MKICQNSRTDPFLTRWDYQESTGLLLSKTDAAGRSVTYAYDKNNFLSTNTWARGVSVAYSYNNYGDLAGMFYLDGAGNSDGTTPSVQFADFNGQGLPQTITDGSGTHSIQYDVQGRILSDTINGITVGNHYDPVYGRDYIRVDGLAQAIQNNYSYDGYGRLQTVSSGNYSATYDYLPHSQFVQTVTDRNGSAAVLTASKGYDYRFRLSGITNAVNGNTVSSYTYAYDAVNRRTQMTLADKSYWSYGYNDRNELTRGNHYWSDNSPVKGQQYGYQFDNIGNRTRSASGSRDLRWTDYAVNNLNEYTSVTVPGTFDVFGTADAGATVTVNDTPTTRRGEYFHAEQTVDNSASPVYASVTTLGVKKGAGPGGVDAQATASKDLFVPQTPEQLVYDNDGNLTQDGQWMYTWDGENRLIEIASRDCVPAEARKRIAFSYDYMGRRVTKQVFAWDTNSNSYLLTSNFCLVYDLRHDGSGGGWNLLAELDALNSQAIVRSYAWGTDLSGAPDQAGGIGGLLWVQDQSTIGNQPSVHFCAFDGNGNVTALVNAGDRTLSACYEFSPFGETIRATGPMADANPFRFSTKFADSETKLVYYGYRYYSPNLGRWIGRDPSGEQGGNNLFHFVRNNTLSGVDPNGKFLLDLLLSMGIDMYNRVNYIWAQGMATGAVFNSLGEVAAGAIVLPPIVIGNAVSYGYWSVGAFFAQNPGAFDAASAVLEGLGPYSGPAMDPEKFWTTCVNLVNSAIESGNVTLDSSDSNNPLVIDALAGF